MRYNYIRFNEYNFILTESRYGTPKIFFILIFSYVKIFLFPYGTIVDLGRNLHKLIPRVSWFFCLALVITFSLEQRTKRSVHVTTS